MPKFLVLQLKGVMQAWGTHTYEDYRPSSIFPTRSAILGLLGACLGVEREDILTRELLNTALQINVISLNPHKVRKIEDFHTVLDARKVDGNPRKDAITSKREYLCDAHFLLFIQLNENKHVTTGDIEKALIHPVFTPFLGRKSCPLTEPLMLRPEITTNETRLIDAVDDITRQMNRVITAEYLSVLQKTEGELTYREQEKLTEKQISTYTIYSEEELSNSTVYEIRDVPVETVVRQFVKRYVHILSKEASNVSL